MIIGIPRERRPDEYRVGLTPAGVELLVRDGHPCHLERGAGVGAGFSDQEFARAGARIAYSGEEVYGRADLVVKVARPTPEELIYLRPGQTVMAFWHLASASPDTLDTLLTKEVTAIAYEMIEAQDGSLPVLTPMSRIAGQMAVDVAATLLRNDQGGKGILLGGMPGVAPAQVVILGAGVVGTHAARAFSGLGATVYVLDRDLSRLERLAEFDRNIITMLSHAFNLRKVVRFADVLVGAVLVPGARSPVLITRPMVREMRPRSVILDIAINQGGCIETSRPTTHHAPTFMEEQVMHYCVPNMPGVLGRTATHALSNATWSYIELIAASGIERAMTINRDLAVGVATHQGRVVSPALQGPLP